MMEPWRRSRKSPRIRFRVDSFVRLLDIRCCNRNHGSSRRRHRKYGFCRQSVCYRRSRLPSVIPISPWKPVLSCVWFVYRHVYCRNTHGNPVCGNCQRIKGNSVIAGCTELKTFAPARGGEWALPLKQTARDFSYHLRSYGFLLFLGYIRGVLSNSPMVKLCTMS